MADIVLFTPKPELDAKRNLEAFIRVASTQLKTIQVDLNFEENIWSYQGTNRNHKIRFGTTASTKKGMKDHQMVPLTEPFLGFSKAYIRYQQGMAPVETPETHRLLVLRVLHDALIECVGTADITALTPIVLDATSVRLKQTYALSSLASYGHALKQIADFVQKNLLAFTPFAWKAPFKNENNGTRVGEDFYKHRDKKLPSPTALASLAQIFCDASEPEDIMFSSIGALLCCGPARISEVMALETNPEHEEQASDGSMKFGLRWRPAKGGASQVKWIPEPMHEVAREALRRIRSLTHRGRELALWYEHNPGRMYLPKSLEHLRLRPLLSRSELTQVLYGEDVDVNDATRRNGANQWFDGGSEETPIPSSGAEIGKIVAYPYATVERKVLAMLPATFPFIDKKRGIKFSDALFVTERGGVQSDYCKYVCMIASVNRAAVISRFGATPSSSIFERHGFREDDGSSIQLKTHQPRHYLNMAAQINHMSQLDIALWSGRRLVAQNRQYDHVSGRDLALRAEEIVGGATSAQVPAILQTPHFLVTRSRFKQPSGVAGHTTEFGHCVHDFTMLPCTLFRDCLNCDEHVCVKGDAVKEAALRRHLDETRELLKEAQLAQAEENYGADRWVEHQAKTMERLEELIAILDNPKVPDGAVIRSRGMPGASRIEQATQRRIFALKETDKVLKIVSRTPNALPKPSTSPDKEEGAA
ncbi:integrase [Massilia sp. DWR3-1-1]|uniref:integrase n=1 Tax=Massilia sp. DWR3-1-1 TaxID=2804559 RepID=UPI003CEDEF37